MRLLLALCVAVFMSGPGWAAGDALVEVKSEGTVSETVERLENAVINAGASVFAKIDHALGAGSVGLTLAPSTLMVFGNPKLGTPAMQDDPRAGLFLPLRVLVYEDAKGQTWLAYEQPQAMFAETSVPAGAAYVDKMTGALAKLTAAASK